MKDIYRIVCNFYDNMMSFNDWWRTVPEDLRNKSRKGDDLFDHFIMSYNIHLVF